MDEQKQDDQPELTYNSSVPIRDILPKTCRTQRSLGRGGERGTGIFVLMTRHCDDDDDDDDERFLIIKKLATCLTKNSL